MNRVTPEEIRSFLGVHFERQLAAAGLTAEDLVDEYDFLEGGLIDSLGLIELISALEESFNIEVDFEDLDPDELTVVGPFCRYVASQSEVN